MKKSDLKNMTGGELGRLYEKILIEMETNRDMTILSPLPQICKPIEICRRIRPGLTIGDLEHLDVEELKELRRDLNMLIGDFECFYILVDFECRKKIGLKSKRKK